MGIEATVRWPGGSASVDAPADESGFWKAVAETFDGIDMPWKGDPTVAIEVRCPLGGCTLEARGRDEAWVDGVKRPSPAIFPAAGSEDGIPGLAPSSYREIYLTFASAESAGGRGSYKFYRFIPRSDGRIDAEYGRIGQGSGFGAPRKVKEPYESWMFWPKVKEKLMKGYRDQSAVYLDLDAKEATGREESDRDAALEDGTASQRLYAKLMELARGAVRRHLVQGTRVTAEQVRESKRILRAMAKLKTVKAFNRRVVQLMQVAPRTVAAVEGQLARSEADFAAVITREESIVAAMEAVVADKARKPEAAMRAAAKLPSFGDFGIGVKVAEGTEREEALSRLSDRLRAKVLEVYAVSPKAQGAKFEAYCKGRGITDTRLLWHGSPAANWASIVQNSLWVPGASGVAHGSMFGRGIYFGENGKGGRSSSEGGGEKSWGYVGARDSYWSRNTGGGTAFMALFEVAYGKPYEPKGPWAYDKATLDSLGCDCIHAKAGVSHVLNDEIVVYDEDAVRMRYLLEFAI